MTAEQLDLLTPALEAVEEHAAPDWKDAAWQVLLRLCRTGQQWTTDEFWLVMRDQHPTVTTHEPRALGPLLRNLVRQGYARKTREGVESTRPEAHKAWCWIYVGKPERQAGAA